jgi:hypothetical protein
MYLYKNKACLIMKYYVDEYKSCFQLSVDNQKNAGQIKLVRSTYLVLILTLVSYINFGQTKPLIIKGKFDNCTVGQIYITFKAGLEETVRDSIKINSDGSFFYKTYQCRIPQSTSLSVPRFVIIDKKGKIVTLDAPRPSDPNNLMRILDRKLSK